MHIVARGMTHVGLVREVNEDAFLAEPNIALVADGMGGHAAGDVASSLAITAFQSLIGRHDLAPGDVVRACERANDAIVTEAARRHECAGMGTTLTGVAVVEQAGSPHWLVFNVGDSRVYRIAGGEALQLTVDHSEVAELVAAGRITKSEARQHPLRNVVTRSLGMGPAPDVETWLIPAEPGDLFLICSDGLTNELADDRIARLVSESADLESAACALIDAAVGAGGHDNVTVVLLTAHDEQPDEQATEAAFSTQPRRRLDGAGTSGLAS